MSRRISTKIKKFVEVIKHVRKKTSKKVGKKTGGPKKNRFFEGLMQGLKEAAAHATGEIELPVRYYDVTPPVDVKPIRTKLKLSQAEFAARFRLNVRTVQDWESSGTQPRARSGHT